MNGYLLGGTPTPLQNMNLSIGMMTFPIYGKNENVPKHQPDMRSYGLHHMGQGLLVNDR